MEENRYTKWPNTALLRIVLLNGGDTLRNIPNGGLVLHLEPETLTFKACLVDQDTGVGLETGEGAHDVVLSAAGMDSEVLISQAEVCIY